MEELNRLRVHFFEDVVDRAFRLRYKNACDTMACLQVKTLKSSVPGDGSEGFFLFWGGLVPSDNDVRQTKAALDICLLKLAVPSQIRTCNLLDLDFAAGPKIWRRNDQR